MCVVTLDVRAALLHNLEVKWRAQAAKRGSPSLLAAGTALAGKAAPAAISDVEVSPEEEKEKEEEEEDLDTLMRQKFLTTVQVERLEVALDDDEVRVLILAAELPLVATEAEKLETRRGDISEVSVTSLLWEGGNEERWNERWNLLQSLLAWKEGPGPEPAGRSLFYVASGALGGGKKTEIVETKEKQFQQLSTGEY